MKVSVIIPAYNSSATIKTCLESAIHQSYPVYEIIIINDGSSDNTIDIVQSVIDSHREISIQFIDKINEGPSIARNLGIQLATGDIIAFLDSDDVWLKDKLERQIDTLKQQPQVAILGGLYKNNNKDNLGGFKEVTFEELLLSNTFFTSATIVKRSVFKSVNPFNINKKYSEDYNLWLRILTQFKGGILNEVVFTYVSISGVNSEGLSGNLWLMEKGELDNYKEMYQLKHISYFKLTFLRIFSLLKYLRRILKKQLKS